MNENHPKTEVKVIVTPDTRFNLGNYVIIDITVQKNDNYIVCHTVSIDMKNVSAANYDRCHIYVHANKSKYYVDIDFNLMPNKEQLSRGIFDQLKIKINSNHDESIGNSDHFVIPFVSDKTFTTELKNGNCTMTIFNALSNSYDLLIHYI